MASHQHLGQHPNPQFQSPAKVFARLKSKVQREGTCASNGIAARKEPPCNVQGIRGAEFTSPRKTTRSARVEDDPTDSDGFIHSRNDAKALTISPIPSPQKNPGFWNLRSILAEDESLVPGRGRGYEPRQGEFLESTALHQAQLWVNGQQIHGESARSRALAGFQASNQTPVKSVGNDCMFKREQTFQISPSNVFSPIKNRLRKRKFEPRDFNNVSSSTKIPSDRRRRPPGGRACGHHPAGDCVVMEDLVGGPSFSAVPPDIGHFPQGPAVPSTTSAKRRCSVILEKCPTMSPAKMFAYMKKREMGAGRPDARRACNGTRHRSTANGFHRSGDTPPAEAHAVDAATGAAEAVLPVCGASVEAAESQSATDSSEDVGPALVLAQPVLFEDPLLLHSPRVTIPKNNTKALKHGWPQPSKVSSEKVIHLKDWCLKHNKKGLYVEGIHREEDILWNSNIIAERVSPYVVKTVTGRIYVLVGKMTSPVDSSFPRSFLKKFLNGFPPKWSKIYEEFLSESRIKDTERRNEDGGKEAKSEASNNFPFKNQRRNLFKTPDACPPSSSSTKMSRSGRVIKAPLEFWKGGRVTLDAQMNVTIHECYDKSICNPEDAAAASVGKLQKSLFPDRRQDKAAPAPQRNIKAPPRRRNKGPSNRGEEPSQSPDAPPASLSISAKGTSRRTRGSRSRRTTESTLPVEPGPRWTTGQTPGPTGKRTGPPSRTSPDMDHASAEQLSDGGSEVRRAKRSNRQHRKRAEDSPQLRHLEESRTERRKRGRAEKDENRTISEPTNLKSSTTSLKAKVCKRSAQIPAEEDKDKWTEEELATLQEAVVLYPKHKANYWAKVARHVGTRSAEDCYNQHTFQGASQSPATKEKKRGKKQLEAAKGPEHPVISARVGTFRRKQQVRHFLETMPKENVEDVFSCTYMQNKRFQIPNTYESHLSDDPDITLRNLEPVTPMSTGFPEVKTPQCLHITPGMMGSPNRSNDDKYVFQLQKRMKKRQFNVCKKTSAQKSFTPTPSVKRTMRRCDNAGQDTFVVWEMFPGNERVLSDSEEEEDYYFSDTDCT